MSCTSAISGISLAAIKMLRGNGTLARLTIKKRIQETRTWPAEA